jgi:citrate (Re)-synthase
MARPQRLPQGLVNSVTAWLYGCGAVNGTLLGFGERTGNAPIEGMLIEYISLRGTTDGIDTTVISEIAEYFERELRYHIPPTYPFVGQNFNNQRRHPRRRHAQERGDLQRLRHRQDPEPAHPDHHHRQVGQGRHRPLAQLPGCNWKGERAVDKGHPGVAKIFKRIMEMYERALHHHLRRGDGKHGPPVPLRASSCRNSTSSSRRPTSWRPTWPRTWPSRPRSAPWTRRLEPVLQRALDNFPFTQFMYVVNTGRAQDHPEHHPHRAPGQIRRNEAG